MNTQQPQQPIYTNHQHAQQGLYINNQHAQQPLYNNNQHAQQPHYNNNQHAQQPLYINNQHVQQPLYINNQHAQQPLYINNQHVQQPLYINNQHAQQPVPIQHQHQRADKTRKTRICLYPSDVVRKYSDDLTAIRKIPKVPHSEKIQRCCIRKEWVENCWTTFASISLITVLLLQIVDGQMGFAQGQPFPMFLEDTCSCKDEINGICPSVAFTLNITSVILSQTSSFYDPENWDPGTGVCSQNGQGTVKPVETCRDTFPIGLMYVLPDNKGTARLSLQDDACWAPDRSKIDDESRIRFSSFENETNIRNAGAFGFILILGLIVFTIDFIDFYVPKRHSLIAFNLKSIIGNTISNMCKRGSSRKAEEKKKVKGTLQDYLGKLIFYVFISLPFNFMIGFITTPGAPLGRSVETQNEAAEAETVIEWSEDSYKGGMLFYPSASELSYQVILILALNASMVLPFCFIVCMPMACCVVHSNDRTVWNGFPGEKKPICNRSVFRSCKCSALISLCIFGLLYLGFLGFVIYELIDSISISFDMDFSVFLFGCSLTFDVPDLTMPVVVFAFSLGLSRMSTMVSQTLRRFDVFIQLCSYCSRICYSNNKILPASSPENNTLLNPSSGENEGGDDEMKVVDIVQNFAEGKAEEKVVEIIRVSSAAKEAAAVAANVAAQASIQLKYIETLPLHY